MKPTEKRLEPYATQILKECAEKGYYAGKRLAEELTGYKGYGFKKWLKKMTGDEDFGLHPTDPEKRTSNFWRIRQKIDDSVLELIHAMDSIAEGEKRKLEAEKELRRALFLYKEARKDNESKMRLAVWEYSYDEEPKIKLCEAMGLIETPNNGG